NASPQRNGPVAIAISAPVPGTRHALHGGIKRTARLWEDVPHARAARATWWRAVSGKSLSRALSAGSKFRECQPRNGRSKGGDGAGVFRRSSSALASRKPH